MWKVKLLYTVMFISLNYLECSPSSNFRTVNKTDKRTFQRTDGEANYNRLHLVRGKPVRVECNSPFNVREVGNMVIINTPQGITLEWNRGNRVHVNKKSGMNVQEITGPCDLNEARRPWAEQTCDTIRSLLFKPCHGVVPPKMYYDECVFAGCTCDKGGDCECIHNAITDYVEECARNGVLVEWNPSNCYCY